MVSKIADFMDAMLEQSQVDLLESAEDLLLNLEKLGMKPPILDNDKRQTLMRVYMGASPFKWDEDFEKDEKAMEDYKRLMEYKALSPEEKKQRRMNKR